MEDICRLCCSTNFVNNNIFDEENALYLKMSLYLPIKVFKNDRLPQKVCDKCSCKVNDFYQFCNETIEVQNRLRTFLRFTGSTYNEDSVDLTRVKSSSSPPPAAVIGPSVCERSTQTDSGNTQTNVPPTQVKDEPKPPPSPEIKEEQGYLDLADHFGNQSSDDDIFLVDLKKDKISEEPVTNGGPVQKRTRKKKVNSPVIETKIDVKDIPEGWDMIMSSLVDNKEDAVVKSEKVKELDEDVFNCCVCFMQLYNRAQMLQHYRQHASDSSGSAPPTPPPPPDQEPLRCTRCRKALSVSEWGRHWARHWERDRRPFRCALCEKSFRAPNQILKHGQTHRYGEGAVAEPVDKRFMCDLCPEGFVYMRYLLAHRTRAHPLEAAARALALRCGTCARTFAHINSLRRHLRAHSGERNFLCNVCGKALSSREHLKFHIRIHTGYKPNVCKTCGKGFVKKCNLTLHERVHSGEKPHVCSHCGKAFSQRSTLVIHERYHSGARPYVCGLCGRGFVAKGLLSMHLKTTCI